MDMTILVVAPHSDDEVLGVGGTIAKHVAEKDDVYVCVVTSWDSFTTPKEVIEKDRQECLAAHHYLGIKQTFFLDLPAAMLNEIPKPEINKKIGDIIDKLQPQIVYIPHFGDMHSDHYIVSQAAMVGVRPLKPYQVLTIYSYETLSETEWNIPHVSNAFIPNTFVNISGYLYKKIKAMGYFESQLKEFPHPRSIGCIESLARVRGSTVRVDAAEAFCLIRKIFF